MNDSAFETSAALGEMSDALVSEAACAKRRSRRPLWAVCAALALALIVGAAIAVPKLAGGRSAEMTALVPQDEPAADAPADEPVSTEAPAPMTAVPVTAAPVTAAPAAPAATPDPGPMAMSMRRFDSVVALNTAVRSGWSNEADDALYGLGSIYMPTKVPYGAELQDVSVTHESVTLTYSISEEWIHDDSDPNRFVLIWYRNWQPGSAESFAGSLFSRCGDDCLEPLHCKDGVWMFFGEGNIERYAVWEKDGLGFEMITPGYYCEDSDTLGFTGLAEVALGDVEVYVPATGFVVDGYLWLAENEFGAVPVYTFAYGTVYGTPEDGAEGVMLSIEGTDLLSTIPEDMRTYEKLSEAFPHVGVIFRPMLLEDTEIVGIDVYSGVNAELIASGLTLEELYALASPAEGDPMLDYLCGDCRGCVLVDIIIAHKVSYIEALDDYEIEAYHCAFILEVGC